MVIVWSVCSFRCSVVSVLSVFRVFSSHWGTASTVLGVISGLGLGFCGGGGLCMGLCFCRCVFLALRFLFCYGFCYGRFGGFLGWFLSGCICSSRQISTIPSVVSAVDEVVIRCSCCFVDIFVSLFCRVCVICCLASLVHCWFPVMMMVDSSVSSWLVFFILIWCWSSICFLKRPCFPIMCPTRLAFVLIISIVSWLVRSCLFCLVWFWFSWRVSSIACSMAAVLFRSCLFVLVVVQVLGWLFVGGVSGSSSLQVLWVSSASYYSTPLTVSFDVFIYL